MLVAAFAVGSLSYGQNWEKNFYVDDFGDATDKFYHSYLTEEGKFSNSATSNSKLTAVLILDGEGNSVKIKLYEYGRGADESLVYESSFGYLMLKDDSDKKYIVPAFALKDGGVYISNTIEWRNGIDMKKLFEKEGYIVFDNGSQFLDLIKNSTSLFTVRILQETFSEYGNSKYLFRFKGLSI